MPVEWQVRPFQPGIAARDVDNPHPRADVAERGDAVVLYVKDDASHQDVRVRVTTVASDGQMEGTIISSGRLSIDAEHLRPGVAVTFDSRNVIRIEKAT